MLSLVLLAAALAADDEAITEISLRRTPCFGKCPVDEVVLRSDGTAEYTGTRHVERLGKHTGRVEAGDFDKLAKLLVENGFFGMEEDYRAPITDQASLITKVTRGGKSREVRDYGRAAPEEMQEIEKAIIEVMDKIDWTAEEGPPAETRQESKAVGPSLAFY